MMKEKHLGKRTGKLKNSAKSINRWQKTVRDLRGNIGVCRRGLYKFLTHKEADQWLKNEIIRLARESRR